MFIPDQEEYSLLKTLSLISITSTNHTLIVNGDSLLADNPYSIEKIVPIFPEPTIKFTSKSSFQCKVLPETAKTI